jgi:hypothetical protein
MATSMKEPRRNAAQLAADGFAAVVEKLGMAEAVRFVQLYHQGAGDYARERHEWLDGMSHDQIANLMAKTTKKNARKRKSKKAQTAGRKARRIS